MHGTLYAVCVRWGRTVWGYEWSIVSWHTSAIRVPSSLSYDTIRLNCSIVRGCAWRNLEKVERISGKNAVNKDGDLFQLSVHVSVAIGRDSNCWSERFFIFVSGWEYVLQGFDGFATGLFGCLSTEQVLDCVWPANLSIRATVTWNWTEFLRCIFGEGMRETDEELPLVHFERFCFFNYPIQEV